MRDPNRIPVILAALGELWQKSPDLRLGQIISNASIQFYTEDDKALLGLQQWIEYYEGRRGVPYGVD